MEVTPIPRDRVLSLMVSLSLRAGDNPKAERYMMELITRLSLQAPGKVTS